MWLNSVLFSPVEDQPQNISKAFVLFQIFIDFSTLYTSVGQVNNCKIGSELVIRMACMSAGSEQRPMLSHQT